MNDSKITGGYILTPREIQDGELAHCPPCVREIYQWLVINAAFKDRKQGRFTIRRGQLLCNYQDMINALSWTIGYRKEYYSLDQVKRAVAVLKKLRKIEAQKLQASERSTERPMKALSNAPATMLVTICNYSTYQDLTSYESTNEPVNERTNESTSIYIKVERKENKENKASNKGSQVRQVSYTPKATSVSQVPECLHDFEDEDKFKAFLRAMIPECKEYRMIGFNQLKETRIRFLNVIKEQKVTHPKNYYRKWVLGQLEKGQLALKIALSD